MIHIVSDFNRLIKENNELVISVVADYVHAYARILEAYENKEELAVYVQLKPIEHWFRQMAGRYPEGSFAFERIDARIRLQQLWDIHIPEAIDPAEIVEAGLLDLDLTPNPGERFEDYLMEIFYDPIYAARVFPHTKLVELLDAYDEEKWNQNKKLRLVYKTYLNRIEQWKTKAKSQERKELITRLSNNPLALRADLIKFKVLQAYKKLGHKLMGKEYALFESLHLNLHPLPVDEKTIPEIITQINYVLKGYGLPSNSTEMHSLVSSVSGYLMSEFEIIEEILHKSPELLSDELVSDIEIKFEALQHRLGKRLARLKKLIQPEKPATPDKGWDIDQMLVWATQQYLPYQYWSDTNNIDDQSLYEMADVFASWLYDNWHEIHANSKRMVFNILPNHASQLSQNENINLILVIDNLGWMQVADLQDLFREHGFYLTLAKPYFSMIPSETEISKKCLLSGSPTYQAIDDKSYTAIIEKGWVPYFNRSDFRYLSDPGKLKGIKELDAQTYVVNYRGIDTALHMSSTQLGLPHTQHIHNLLAGFVETIVDFVKKHDLDNKAKIHIVSDHGSLRISEQAPNDLNPDSFKGSDFPHVAHRYIEVTNTGFEKLSDNLKTDCFFIPSNEFGNPKHYLCARRANRFLPTDGTFYVHGGLSPEEVVVPHLIFEAAVAPVQDLTVIMTRNQFRYRMETVELEIGNPNTYTVENIHVTTLNSNFKMETQTIEWLNSGRNIRLPVRGLFKQTHNPEERKLLSFLIRYECHGEKYAQTVKLPIEMIAMVELRDTSMFEDLD